MSRSKNEQKFEPEVKPSNVPNPEEGPTNFPDDFPQTVDPALAEDGGGHVGANRHYADRPHLDPLDAARPVVANDQKVIAIAERETRERKLAQLEREAARAEADEARAESERNAEADAGNIKTRSEVAKMSFEDQAKFRAANGTMVEDYAGKKKK